MTEQQSTRFVLSDKAYNNMKKVVQLGLPATSSLYFGLASIWGLPGAEQVVGTIAVITTFLGVTLGVSTKQFNAADTADGEMVVITDGGGVRTFSLEVDGDPDELAGKEEIKFKVRKTDIPEPPE